MIFFWYLVGSLRRPIPVRCNWSVCARKMHSTTKFAMTILSKCVCVSCVWVNCVLPSCVLTSREWVSCVWTNRVWVSCVWTNRVWVSCVCVWAKPAPRWIQQFGYEEVRCWNIETRRNSSSSVALLQGWSSSSSFLSGDLRQISVFWQQALVQWWWSNKSPRLSFLVEGVVKVQTVEPIRLEPETDHVSELIELRG